jgi:hypothetical protein
MDALLAACKVLTPTVLQDTLHQHFLEVRRCFGNIQIVQLLTLRLCSFN